MKIEVKKLDDSKRELFIEVSGERIKNKYEDIFNKVSKEAKVPGFRPGNAPRDMIEKHYASLIHEQMLKDLVPDVYNEAIGKENLDVIELPEITEVKLEKDTLSFKATVEVSPDIDIKNYKKQKIDYKSVTVGPDDIKRSIDSLKEMKKVDNVDDNFAKGLGYPNVKELENVIEKQLFIQKENLQRQKIENEIIDNLTKGLDFKIPGPLAARQLEDLVRHTKVDLAMKGYPREKIEEQDAELRKKLEPEAGNQVKVYLVLAAIAKKENIALDDDMPRKVMELLLKEADWKESA